MKRNLLLVVVALCAASMVWAAVPGDFTFSIVPGDTVLKGPPAGTASGSVDLAVMFGQTIGEVQGWSFGAIVAPAAGATMNITALAVGAGTQACKNGGRPSFESNLFFGASTGTEASAGGIDEGAPVLVADITIPDCIAITQGVVIDFNQKVSLGSNENFEMATFTVNVSGPVGDAKAEIGRVNFTDLVGSPPTATVVVHGGASIAPAVQAPAIISAEPAVCATANDFSIWMTGGDCATGATVESLVTLNFNGNATNEGAAIQGWSYGLCTDALLDVHDITDAVSPTTTAGTDVATVKNGAAASFDTITVYPEGVTHAIVIDFNAKVTLAARNAYSDLRVVMTANVSETNPVANIKACTLKLGAPPTANVMVINGASLPSSTFEGVLAERATDTVCCPGIPDTACNKPAEFRFSAGAKFVPGSANGDGRLDIADGIYILNYLFRGGPALPCEKAGDANGDCGVDSADAIYIITYQFLDGPAPVSGVGCQVIGNDVCPALTCEVQEAKC